MTETARGFAFVEYNYTSGSRQFTIHFPYLRTLDIRAWVGAGVDKVEVPFSWINANTIEITDTFLPAPAAVTVQRITEQDERLVNFTDGAYLPAQDLNLIVKQLFFLTQELTDTMYQIATGGGVIPTGMPGVEQIALAVLQSNAMAPLIAELGSVDLLAEAVIRDTLRTDEFNDELRMVDSRLDALE